MSEAAMRAALADLGIAFSELEHAPVFTVEESAAIHAAMPGEHTRNLFLKDARGQHWLVTAGHARRIDLKALAPAIGAAKLSFGKPEAMEALLGVSPGAVTPLAAFNDRSGQVRMAIDSGLADAAQVNVHPLRNSATIGLSGADLCRALTAWHHPPLVADLPERA